MTKNSLTVEAIFIPGSEGTPVHTEGYLYSLSDTEWSELRAQVTRSRRSGSPLLQCGDCHAPVYARESSTGRRHCYHFGTDLKDCRWASANAQNFRAIDAYKFHGNQEGECHKRLKNMICEILALDPASSEAGVTCERYTKGDNTEYAYPDVFTASWQGGPAAFEIQLATTQLPTIIRREDFYKANGIRLCWIVGNEIDNLKRRAFKDIHLRNDGQIFSVDCDVLAAARKAAAPRFRLHRLLPGTIAENFIPTWKHKIVSVEDIDWGMPGAKPLSAQGGYDRYLNTLIERDKSLRLARQNFYVALRKCDHISAGEIWDKVVIKVGGEMWTKLGDGHNTVRALGVLATVRRGVITTETQINLDNLPHLVNSMLLEPKERRHWTHALQTIAKITRPNLLLFPSIKKKCERNRIEQADSKPTDLAIGQAFNVFFPEGAFQRLQLAATVPNTIEPLPARFS